MDCVVTGATGYLGTQVTNILRRQGCNVIAGSRADIDLRNIRAADALPRDAIIFHCAAVVPRTAADYADESQARDSLAMVQTVLMARPRHLVFTSSMVVYADASVGVTEDQAAPPRTGYAGMKRRAELLILAEASCATILRLPGLFGPPRRGGLLHNTAAAFAAGRTPEIVAEPPTWAAMHVADAAEICARAMLRACRGSEVINVGYDCPLSIPLAVAALAERFGVTAPRLPAAHAFHMDLHRMNAVLGPPPQQWADRLDELVRSFLTADA